MEKIFANYVTNRGFLSKIAHTSQYQKLNNESKNGQKTSTDTSLKKTRGWPRGT